MDASRSHKKVQEEENTPPEKDDDDDTTMMMKTKAIRLAPLRKVLYEKDRKAIREMLSSTREKYSISDKHIEHCKTMIKEAIFRLCYLPWLENDVSPYEYPTFPQLPWDHQGLDEFVWRQLYPLRASDFLSPLL